MTMQTDDNVRLSRRDLLGASVIGAAAIAATSSLRAQDRADHAGDVLETRGHPNGQRLPTNAQSGGRYRPRFRVGIGGTQSGNCFGVSSDGEVEAKYAAAWGDGLRYFYTSPYYGNGLSERRLGSFLHNHPRDDYVLSSKIGRLFHPTTKALPVDPFFQSAVSAVRQRHHSDYGRAPRLRRRDAAGRPRRSPVGRWRQR